LATRVRTRTCTTREVDDYDEMDWRFARLMGLKARCNCMTLFTRVCGEMALSIVIVFHDRKLNENE
jgi:hypothetical protein